MTFTYDDDPRMEKEYEEVEPICPICGSKKCDYFYKVDGEVIGCDDCVEREDVWE